MTVPRTNRSITVRTPKVKFSRAGKIRLYSIVNNKLEEHSLYYVSFLNVTLF